MGEQDPLLAQTRMARAARHALLGVGLRPLIEFFGSHPPAEGLENLADLQPPFLVAANHSSHMDTPLVLLSLPPRLRSRTLVAAAADYFFASKKPGLSAFVSMAVGAVPIERRHATRKGMDRIKSVLEEGWCLLLYPEGTRTPDGRLYRGKTGAARIALETRVPVVPVGITGTYDALPSGRSRPQVANVSVAFGKPLTFERFYDAPFDQNFLLRAITDRIMYEIMRLTGQVYVDEYGERAKSRRTAKPSEPAEDADQSAEAVGPGETPEPTADPVQPPAGEDAEAPPEGATASDETSGAAR